MLQIHLKFDNGKLTGRIPSLIGEGEVEVVVDTLRGIPEGYSDDCLMAEIQDLVPAISRFKEETIFIGDGVFKAVAIITITP
jgi:hypothetical protein